MTVVTEAAAATTTSAADPTPAQHWRRYRWIGAVIVLAFVIAVIVAVLGSSANTRELDPRSYEPSGTHALAALLAQRGVHVEAETTASAAEAAATAGDTLVVVHPSWLREADLAALAASPADLVVLGASEFELGTFDFGVVPGGEDYGPMTVTPECDLPAATTARAVAIGSGPDSYAYQTPDGGEACYPVENGDALVTFEQDGRRVTLLGDPSMVTNAQLAHEGNAALALGLLDARPKVVWLAPVLTGATAEAPHASVSDFLPSRLKWAVLQLVIAVVVLALWRGRRLGRLVPEALPVVVRQAETVVGRARLYRRSRSLDAAAKALRAGSRNRLARRLGFGPHAEGDALTDAIARRIGKPARGIAAVLYGPTPTGDRELVALARELANLEQEVRAS